MKELATYFRTMNLYAHSAHNLASGNTFFNDHKMLAKFYEEYDNEYDMLVERIIGLYGKDSVDLLQIQIIAIDDLKNLPFKVVDNNDYFKAICELEKKVCEHVKQLVKVEGVTEGTKNLLADMADRSEMRQYLIKQRIC